jgi:prepilin-type N-terminal cleavage/methylation domain-containing protein
MEKSNRHNAGFTLVELSVVLVIISFLLAAVIVGRKMVNDAEARTILTEMTSYQSAVGQFQTKYGYLPGDIPAAQAAKYFADTESAQSGGSGNGGWDTTTERNVLWRHLYAAEMIEARTKTTGGTTLATDTIAMPGGNRPASKVGGAGYTLIAQMQICPATVVGCATTNTFTRVLRIGASDGSTENLRTPAIPVKTHMYLDSKIDSPNTPFSGKYTVSAGGANMGIEANAGAAFGTIAIDTCGTNSSSVDIYPTDQDTLCLGQYSETASK